MNRVNSRNDSKPCYYSMHRKLSSGINIIIRPITKCRTSGLRRLRRPGSQQNYKQQPVKSPQYPGQPGLAWCQKNTHSFHIFNSHDNVYGAVIMTQSHCESSPGSTDECSLSATWPPTLRPSQSTWAVSPPKIGSYHPHPPFPLLLLLSP